MTGDNGLHDQLAERFPRGLVWVDCGISLQTSFPQFVLSARQKALSLALELQEPGDELELDHMVKLPPCVEKNLQQRRGHAESVCVRDCGGDWVHRKDTLWQEGGWGSDHFPRPSHSPWTFLPCTSMMNCHRQILFPTVPWLLHHRAFIGSVACSH